MRTLVLAAALVCLSTPAYAAFSFIDSEEDSNSASGQDLTVTFTVSAGDTIVIGGRFEATTTTVTVTNGNGTDNTNFVCATAIGSSNIWGSLCRLPAATATGSVTYTYHLAAARTWRSINAFQFRGSGAVTYMSEPSGGGTTGSSTTCSSGNLTTTGTQSKVIVGFGFTNSTGNYATRLINGSAADTNAVNNASTLSAIWYLITTTAFTSNSQATITNQAWGCGAVALTEPAAGGAVAPRGALLGVLP